jgi:hypothetical protein
MAIPTEYLDNGTSVGSNNIKHPIYTFKVLMKRQLEENVGPVTNNKSVSMLHPDQHDNSPDRGQTNQVNHETQYQPIIPGFLRGNNIVRNDDGTFTAYGAQGTYLKEQYADIANPLLVLQNAAPYTVA